MVNSLIPPEKFVPQTNQTPLLPCYISIFIFNFSFLCY